MFADGGEVEYLTDDDFAKISEKIERQDLEKHRKLGTHKKFTDWWYNGGREIAIKKYGDDENVAWIEAYEDFKDEVMAKGGEMADGGMMFEEGDIVMVIPEKLEAEITNIGKDFVTVEFINRRPEGGDKRGTYKINQIKKITMAKGGSTSHYNTGRSWHLDRARHNNSESWENKKKKIWGWR